MRIFPEGTEDWLEPYGKAMQVLAGFLVAIALAAFIWRFSNLLTWKTTQGETTAAQVTRRTDDSGMMMCSADYTVQYQVNGVPHRLPKHFGSSSSNCSAWERRVAAIEGTKTTVLYNPKDPNVGYVDGGRSIEFFWASVCLALLALGFGLAGTAARRLGRWMQNRALSLP